jgi:copper homeostasis protein CutC
MTKIFGGDGQELGDLDLSEKMLAVLEHEGDVALTFHTPQLLRYVLGERAGSFILRKHETRVLVDDVDTLRRYIALQRDIKTALEKL